MDTDPDRPKLWLEFRRSPRDGTYGWVAAVHGLTECIEREGWEIVASAKGPATKYGVLELRLRVEPVPTEPRYPIHTRVHLLEHTEPKHRWVTHKVVLDDVLPELARHGFTKVLGEPRAEARDKRSSLAIRVGLSRR